jgi:hypothetical protein
LLEASRPESLEAWLALLVAGLRLMPPRLAAQLVPAYPFESTNIASLFEEDATDEARAAGASALLATVKAWMDGVAITDVAAEVVGAQARGDSSRSSGSPLPKMFAVIDSGIGFGLSRAAGVFAALARLGTDAAEEPWSCSSDERRVLNLMPLAIRFGCESVSSLAWYRWGFRRRRIAHLLAAHLPPPEGLEDPELAAWVRNQARRIVRGEDPPGLTDAEALVISSLRRAAPVL